MTTNVAGGRPNITTHGAPTPAEAAAKAEVEEDAREEALEEYANALDVLLGAEAVKQQEKWKLPKRKGLPSDLVLTLNSLTDREFKDISSEAEEPVRGANRRARRSGEANKEINPDKFLRLIVAKGVTDPDFGHPDVLRKHRVHTAEEVVQRVLIPGEIAKIAEFIMDLSGFNDATLEYVGN